MRRQLALISAVAALLGGLSGYGVMQWQSTQTLSTSIPAPPASPPRLALGQPVPSFVLMDVDDQPIHFPEYFSGQMLLVNMWASWCAPCVKEIPELAQFSATQDENGVHVVGIALDHQQAVRDFMQRIAIPYVVVLDLPGADDASVKLGNHQGLLPYSVLIDRQGRLLQQKLGPFQHGEVAQWVASALNHDTHP